GPSPSSRPSATASPSNPSPPNTRGFTFQDEAGGSSPPRPTTAIDQHKRWSACPEPVGLAGYRTKNAYLVTVPGHQARSATPASCLVCKLAATAPHKRATATTAENPVSPAPASTLEDRSTRPLKRPGERRSSAARLSERARIRKGPCG